MQNRETEGAGEMEQKKKSSTMKVAAMQSIQMKIMMLVAAAAAMVGILVIVIFSTEVRSQTKTLIKDYMYDLARAYTVVLEDDLDILGDIQPGQDFWSSKVGNISISEMDGSYAYVVSKDGTMIFHPTPDKIGKPVENAVVTGVVGMLKAGNIPEATAVEYEYKGATKYAAYSVVKDGTYIFVITADEKEAMKNSDRVIRGSIGFTVIAILIWMVIAYFICARIVKPLREIAKMIHKVATMDFRANAEQRKLSKRKDEVGVMSRALEELRGELARVVSQISEQSGRLFGASQAMNQKAESVTSTVEQVDHAVQEIAEGATSQADETQRATESVVSMGTMIEASTENMELLRENARGMRTAGQEAAVTLSNLDEINRQAIDAIEIIYTQTNTTNESALKIKEATGLITSIAEETNLLSLNATIEAARAGEQGRGFAVVAGQIQKLAEQSNESARKIEEIISSLLEDSQKAVNTMDEVKEVMNQQNENVVKTRDKFNEVQDGIGKTIDGIRDVAGQLEQIDKARTDVVEVVQNLTAIAEENAAGTQETSASVTEVGDHMLGIAKNSGELREIADSLDQEMKLFQV